VIASEYPGEGSIYLTQDIKFIKPCFVGEWITVKIELIQEIKKVNSTIYKLSTQILNIENEILIEGGATVLLRE
jgi:acyl dehydratase